MRLHPLKFDRGCGAPLLRVKADLKKYLFHKKSTKRGCTLVKKVLLICSLHPSLENPNFALHGCRVLKYQ